MILVPLPDHPYYLWQALVQAVYLREHGWPVTFLVYLRTAEPSAQLRRIMAGGLAAWQVWPEWRTQDQRGYDAAMKPWLVGRYLSENPEMVHEQLLVLDPDALPLRPWPDAVPGVLLGSDTDSYTGRGYLQSKAAWEPLCRLVGADPDGAAGYRGVGAQYVFTGIPGAWWESVAESSVEAFRMLSAIPTPAGDPYPVQAWCAEMYVTHLAAIRDGLEPRVAPGLDMVWANGPRASWDTAGIFHDAGQQTGDGHHFCKMVHQSSPWHGDISVDPDSASAPYVDLIRRTAAAYPDLVW